MSKNFSCCELIERIETSGSWKSWKGWNKYLAVEFLDKSTTRHIPDRISDTEKVITKYESIFCEKCRKWFDEQREKQTKILDDWIEDRKSKGELEEEFVKLSSGGMVEKGTVMDEVAKNLEKSLKEKKEKDLMNDYSPFWERPVGKNLLLMFSIVISASILSFLLGCYFTKRKYKSKNLSPK